MMTAADLWRDGMQLHCRAMSLREQAESRGDAVAAAKAAEAERLLAQACDALSDEPAAVAA
jgi:hypothetical protein